MDETTNQAAADDEQPAPVYLSNCDPGDETDETAQGPALAA